MNSRMSSTLPGMREARGLLVASAGGLAGDLRDVDQPARPQRDPVRGDRPVGERDLLADEAGDLDALDRAEVVDQPLGGGLVALDERKILAAHVRDEQAPAVVGHGVLDHPPEQQQLAELDRLEHALEDLVDVGAGLDQPRGEPERVGARRAVLEPAGVGDEADVERLGDLRRDLDAEAVEDPRQDLGGRRRVAVDDVHVAEAAVVVVVVDVDDAARRSTAAPRGSRRAGARCRSRRRAASTPRSSAGSMSRSRPVRVEEADLVRDRRRRLEVHAHLFSELAQTAGRGGHRPDRVAVGVLVGRDQRRGPPQRGLRRPPAGRFRSAMSVIRGRARPARANPGP